MPDFSYNAYRKALSHRPTKPPIGRCVFSIDCRVDAEFGGGGWKNVLISVGEHFRGREKVEAYSYKRKVRTGGGEALVQSAKVALETGDLPSRKETGRIVGELTRDFLAGPRGAIKRGFEREQAFREAYKLSTGRIPPTKREVAQAGARSAMSACMATLKNNSKDLVVNSSGFVGSIIGGAATGGLGGQLAGDLAGAGIARKAVMDVEATKSAFTKLSATEEYKSAGFLRRLQMVRKESISELNKNWSKDELEVVGDTAGWAVGSTTAEAARLIPGVGSLPFKGAIVAAKVNPKVQKAYTRLKAGESPRRVIPELGKEVAGIPKEIVTAGNQREQALRAQIKSQILAKKRELLARAASAMSEPDRSTTSPPPPRPGRKTRQR